MNRITKNIGILTAVTTKQVKADDEEGNINGVGDATPRISFLKKTKNGFSQLFSKFSINSCRFI
jgi:hypothetical protein